MKPRGAPDCRTAALAYLARRSHTRRELWQKLRRKGCPEAEIEEVLDRLTRAGLVDDAAAAAAVVRVEAGKGRGRSRVARALSSKGVVGHAAATALSALDPEDEAARLRAALERKDATLRPGLTAAARSKKLFDHLVRRGFAPGAVRDALREKGNQVDDDPE